LITDGKPGAVRGIRIFYIKPGDICGLQNGDLIESINGVPLTGPEAGAALKRIMPSANHAVLSRQPLGVGSTPTTLLYDYLRLLLAEFACGILLACAGTDVVEPS
jgi:hypothetical protein